MPTPPPDPIRLIRLRSDLIAEGLTDNQIKRLVRDKVLHRIRYGAYIRHQIWADADPIERHRLLCRAILRGAHETTTLTHVSSLTERGIPLWGIDLGVAHTTRTKPTAAGRRSRDWVPHRGVLTASQVEVLHGVRISTAARSAMEVTTIAGVEASLVAVNGLLRAKAMTLLEFAAEVKACQFWPSSLTSDLVLRLADPRLESIGEDRFSFLAYMQGLPKPTPQVKIFDEFGRLFARVDFAWPEFEVFLEFDGKVKYERFRNAGETLDDFLIREKHREERICQLTGWVCIRITWADLHSPELLAGRIRALLASRRSAAS